LRPYLLRQDNGNLAKVPTQDGTICVGAEVLPASLKDAQVKPNDALLVAPGHSTQGLSNIGVGQLQVYRSFRVHGPRPSAAQYREGLLRPALPQIRPRQPVGHSLPVGLCVRVGRIVERRTQPTNGLPEVPCLHKLPPVLQRLKRVRLRLPLLRTRILQFLSQTDDGEGNRQESDYDDCKGDGAN
jgi:hypothetical protein